LFRISYDLTVGVSLYDIYSGRLVLHVQAADKEGYSDMKTVLEYELNGQEEYQLEQYAAVPRAESTDHNFLPEESKEM